MIEAMEIYTWIMLGTLISSVVIQRRVPSRYCELYIEAFEKPPGKGTIARLIFITLVASSRIALVWPLRLPIMLTFDSDDEEMLARGLLQRDIENNVF